MQTHVHTWDSIRVDVVYHHQRQSREFSEGGKNKRIFFL